MCIDYRINENETFKCCSDFLVLLHLDALENDINAVIEHKKIRNFSWGDPHTPHHFPCRLLMYWAIRNRW
jgi:hypothetical protein